MRFVPRWAGATLCVAGLAACDELAGGVKLSVGLDSAIRQGKSPFILSEALGGKWTEICFFGPNDKGEELDLETGREAEWLVVYDGDRVLNKVSGAEAPVRLRANNQTRTCFTPQSRVTIVSAKDRTLRFEDGRPWRSRRK